MTSSTTQQVGLFLMTMGVWQSRDKIRMRTWLVELYWRHWKTLGVNVQLETETHIWSVKMTCNTHYFTCIKFKVKKVHYTRQIMQFCFKFWPQHVCIFAYVLILWLFNRNSSFACIHFKKKKEKKCLFNMHEGFPTGLWKREIKWTYLWELW